MTKALTYTSVSKKTRAFCIGAEEFTWIRVLPSLQKIRGYGEIAANVLFLTLPTLIESRVSTNNPVYLAYGSFGWRFA